MLAAIHQAQLTQQNQPFHCSPAHVALVHKQDAGLSVGGPGLHALRAGAVHRPHTGRPLHAERRARALLLAQRRVLPQCRQGLHVARVSILSEMGS